MAEKLTQEMIAEGMVRAEKLARRPGDQWCYPVLNRLEDAQSSCALKGRCSIRGTRRVILVNSRWDGWDVWLGRRWRPIRTAR